MNVFYVSREMIEGLVRAPSSFARLLYFSQFPVLMKDSTISPNEYYCKFRMIPFEGGPIEGLPSVKDQEEPWNIEAKPDDNRDHDYLRKEIIGRLKTQSRKNPKPHFRLQARFKKKEDRLTSTVPNFSMYWSDVSWEDEPWTDVATITLTGAMDDASQKQLRMNVSNLPSCFYIEKPIWSSHPSWIMYARKEIYPTARLVRYKTSLIINKICYSS